MSEWGLLIYPACGLIAALGTGWLMRGRTGDDGSLYWTFVALYAMAMLLGLGVLRTEWAQRRLDPMLDTAIQLSEHPLMQQLRTEDAEQRQIRMDITRRVAEGAPMSEAIAATRPWLAQIGNRELGWVDASTRIRWAALEVATLRELRASNVEHCARVAQSQLDPDGLSVLANRMSADNNAEFETAFIELMKAREIGIGGRQAPAPALEFNDVARRYSEIADQLKGTYGATVVDYLARARFERHLAPVDDHGKLCDYRIAQLSAYLAEPPAMASRLIDSAMR
jgi:hypothetical protein